MQGEYRVVLSRCALARCLELLLDHVEHLIEQLQHVLGHRPFVLIVKLHLLVQDWLYKTIFVVVSQLEVKQRTAENLLVFGFCFLRVEAPQNQGSKLCRNELAIDYFLLDDILELTPALLNRPLPIQKLIQFVIDDHFVFILGLVQQDVDAA